MSGQPVEHHNPYGRDNVRRGILHYLSGRTLAGISAVSSVVLLARYMSIVDYAGYTALTGLLLTATQVSELGVTRAIARYAPEGRLHQTSQGLARLIWGTALVRVLAALVISSLIYLAWPLFLRLFEVVRIGHFPWALTCYLLATVLFLHFSAVLQSLVQQKALMWLSSAQWGGRLLMILLFIWRDGTITLNEALWVIALPELAGAMALLLFIKRHLSILTERASPANSAGPWPNWGEVRGMALHNYAYNLMGMAPQGYFMRMVVAALLPPPFVAAYGFFLSLLERARQYLPLQLMLALVEPVIIANYLKDRDFGKLTQRVQLLYKANLLILAPALVVVAFCGDDITHLLVGSKFPAYSWLMEVILVQLIIANHMLTTQLLLNAVGESDILTKTGLFSVLSMATAALILLATVDHKFIVIAPLAYEIANNLFATRLLRRRSYPYTVPWQFFAKLAGITAAAYIATAVFRQMAATSSLLEFGISAGIAAMIFAIGYFLAHILDAQDTLALKSLLPGSRFQQRGNKS